MIKIYLAGPIAGCTTGEANDWRGGIAAQFNEGIVGVSPLRCEPLHGDKYELVYDDPRFGTPMAISGKNYLDTMSCDMVLAYLPKALNERRPSYGTIIEIGWAIAMRKPIIVVTDDPLLTKHPLVSSNVNWIVTGFDDAVAIVNGLFTVYTDA